MYGITLWLFEPRVFGSAKMKQLNETFEDEEFAHLLKVKADKTWRRFLLDITDYNSYSPKESVGEGGGS